jgi:hypothetical protein
MSETLSCWRCGAGLEALSLPLSRLDECPECSIQLHVCRMCTHFDSAVVRSCSEDDADDVKEKERANFCDYFSPSAEAYAADLATADRQARGQLGALFGNDADDDEADGPADSAADDLFK